jgi:hypothetical protein
MQRPVLHDFIKKNELFGGDEETMGGGGVPVASAP